ncbi:IS30 family transposase [Novosphingobium sp. G106]|uniref:IS30 family transposase n=1 Tax=Novosphingobium sp. G106 TaxID=2849500 RepID=UPI001C2D53D2|nr:IS30 family transposase [Novosphingobium sp. G106]MBV1692228.1 IS30 family transposase [Novosphingobium sp. G106]
MSHCYRQLRLPEREALFRMKAAKLPVRKIAAELGRHPSTIYRELRRNYFFDEDAYFRGYFPSVAHKLARDRRVPGRKLERNPELANYVIDRLRSCWSPEEIAGRLRLAGDSGFRVSHETIYRYVNGAAGKQQDLYRLLPWSRRRRRPRGGRKPHGLKIPLTNSIGQRPMAIARRDEFGHWEGDLVAFRQVYGKSTSHRWLSGKAGLPYSGAIRAELQPASWLGSADNSAPFPVPCASRSRSIGEPSLPPSRRCDPNWE